MAGCYLQKFKILSIFLTPLLSRKENKVNIFDADRHLLFLVGLPGTDITPDYGCIIVGSTDLILPIDPSQFYLHQRTVFMRIVGSNF